MVKTVQINLDQPFQLGDWTVHPDSGEMKLRGGKTVVLRRLEMDVLLYLASRPGKVVGAREILEHVWAGISVNEESVYHYTSKLRQALGQAPGSAPYIETIPKRGYRLVATLSPVTALSEGEDSEATASKTWSGPRVFIGLAGLLALTIVLVIIQFQNPRTPPATAAERFIAVLPFKDLSPDRDQSYFTDGITEELLNTLAGVNGLQVAARTSSFFFKDTISDAREIGEILGVDHLLEGSVQRTGDRIRITAQLIDAKSGFNLWSQTYDRELDDIFAIQDDISAAIVAALSETLGLTLPAAPKLQQTANSAAYDEYLMGILEASRRTGASLEAAKQHLERALELDPGYAPAHARLSITLGLLPGSNNRYTFEGLKETRAYHTERAMALAPNAPESLAAKGFYAWGNVRQAGSLREVRAIFERVVVLNPSYTDVLIWLATVSWQQGDYQAKIDLDAQILRIDPFSVMAVVNNSGTMIRTGRFDEARTLIERLKTLSPALYWSQSAGLARERGLIADAAIYHLERLAVDRTSNSSRFILASMLAFDLGLADETSRFDHRNFPVMAFIGQMEEALSIADGWAVRGTAGALGWVLLQAGRPAEAVGYLNQVWDKGLTDGTVGSLRPVFLLNRGRARQMTGDRAGGEEVLELVLTGIGERRAVGMNYAELDWVEGVARYFLGQKEAGLPLIKRGVERGFSRDLMDRQHQSLRDDPAFAPILAIHKALAAVERDKFLTVVCNGGNPAPEVWTPKPETCEGYVEG